MTAQGEYSTDVMFKPPADLQVVRAGHHITDRDWDKITQRERTRESQSARAFNPLAREERELFAALANGGHHIRGFTNQDIRDLYASAYA